MYDHPADPDLPFVKSYDVGGSLPVRLARKLTSSVNDVSKFLDSIDPLP